ncbi:MAG: hypothetical protein ACHRHE_10205 [Tepidisphaerales bacterium]
MKRHLFTILAAISLLLCVAAVALLVRSYWICDSWVWDRPKTQDNSVVDNYAAISERGLIYARYIPAWDVAPAFYSKSPWNFRADPSPRRSSFPADTVWQRWGFHYVVTGSGRAQWMVRLRSYRSETGWEFTLPHWFVAAMFSILPAIRLWAWRRQRRRNRVGLCPTCGYDLRATADHCPECGTGVPACLERKPIQ